ncbi:oligosaccharide flippase family protein [Enterococcus faecalis]|uniref:oligosaccharide flippase family protein n=1 Tax=Enterococcus faecalis TaxID=1351 RepID=UPI00209067ED|nr:oligosaccharide flippase family protein [Enterococcus faecalis]MCO5432262.1 oligosaccharide flippase family protein [Enterococcus faecalis]
MNKKIINNFVYQGIYQVSTLVFPIITIPIVSNALGSEGVGTYNYIGSIVSYFVMVAGLGLSNYGIREIASVREDSDQRNKCFWELEALNFILTLLTLFIFVLFSFTVDKQELYLLSGISILAVLFDITWFFYGIEDFKKITIINFVIKALTCLMIIRFIHTKDDLYVYFIIQSGGTLLANLSMWFFIPKKVEFIKIASLDVLKHVVPAARFFIGKISVVLYTTVNKSLLGIFGTLTFVGLYTNSMLLISISVTMVSVLDNVLMPHMTKLYISAKKEKMKDILNKTIQLQLFFSILLFFGLVLVTPKLVPWLFGLEFSYTKYLIPFLSIIVVVQPLGFSISRQFLIPMNKIKEYNKSVMYAGFLGILINLTLIPFIGVWGAVVASILSETFVTIYRILELKREMNYSLDYAHIFKLVLIGIVMLSLTRFLTTGMSETIGTSVVQMVIGSVIYFIGSILFKVNPINIFNFKLKKISR